MTEQVLQVHDVARQLTGGQAEQRPGTEWGQIEGDPVLEAVVADRRRRCVESAHERLERARLPTPPGIRAMSTGSSRLMMNVRCRDGSPRWVPGGPLIR